MKISLGIRQNCNTGKSLREKYTKSRSNSDIAIANEVRMSASKAFSPRTGHTMAMYHFQISRDIFPAKFFLDTHKNFFLPTKKKKKKIKITRPRTILRWHRRKCMTDTARSTITNRTTEQPHSVAQSSTRSQNPSRSLRFWQIGALPKKY